MDHRTVKRLRFQESQGRWEVFWCRTVAGTSSSGWKCINIKRTGLSPSICWEQQSKLPWLAGTKLLFFFQQHVPQSSIFIMRTITDVSHVPAKTELFAQCGDQQPLPFQVKCCCFSGKHKYALHSFLCPYSTRRIPMKIHHTSRIFQERNDQEHKNTIIACWIRPILFLKNQISNSQVKVQRKQN